MKLKFLAGAGPISYDINGGNINGIDTSLFTEGAIFTGSPATSSAGIFNMQWVEGDLHVTLAQRTKAYQLPALSHGWAESEWIDAADYDPAVCYVKATNPLVSAMISNGEAEYWQDPEDGKWTVRPLEQEESA